MQNKKAAPQSASPGKRQSEQVTYVPSYYTEGNKQNQGGNMERIIITKHSIQENKNELVRLRKDAQRAVYRMQRESGLSASFIVSEIVRQAENFVEFTEGGDVQMH